MTSRGLTFGSAAAAYERFRFGYPDELVARVLAYAGRPVATAFEIGAGTGKATRAFAAHGIEVTATDPDAAMLAELRRRVPLDRVRIVQCTLESAPAGDTYDVVFAGASLHWTEPNDRWPRVAALLADAGVVAVFGAPVTLADESLAASVAAARKPWLGDDGIPSPDGTPVTDSLQWPGSELQRSDLFTDVQQEVLRRRLTVDAEDYVGLLSTISAYLQLPEHERVATLNAVRDVLPDAVEIQADIWLHLARRSKAR